MKFSIAILTTLVAASSASICDEQQQKDIPSLCSLLDAAESDPTSLADELAASELSTIMQEFELDESEKKVRGDDTLPIVVAHGMVRLEGLGLGDWGGGGYKRLTVTPLHTYQLCEELGLACGVVFLTWC